MKKTLLCAFILASVAISAFATGESNISYFILQSFKRDFKDATNVTWTSKTGLAEASFILNNRKTEAFYNHNGTLFAVSHAIDLDELPVRAKRAFAKRYAGYTVNEAIQFEESDELSYYISAENEKETIIIKVDRDSQLSIFKKSKK